MSGDEKVQQSVSEIQGAVERLFVKTALLGRSHQVLGFALSRAGIALERAGMKDDAQEAARALREANAILEEAK